MDMIPRVLTLPADRFRWDFSLALGTSELTPMEMLKGYGVLANKGKDINPYGIIKVENRHNKVIWDPESEIRAQQREQIVDPAYVFLITDMMSDVIRAGTARGAANRAGFHIPAAGKTGTSSNFKDAWFAGFTPNIATAVWIGFDKGISLGRDFETGAASFLAAPVWFQYMAKAAKDYQIDGFRIPAGIITSKICVKSGLKPGPFCKETLEDGNPGVIDEFFIYGTAPTKECDICEKEQNISEEELKKLEIFNHIKDKETN
jgi:penicillin-binding protein 1A